MRNLPLYNDGTMISLTIWSFSDLLFESRVGRLINRRRKITSEDRGVSLVRTTIKADLLLPFTREIRPDGLHKFPLVLSLPLELVVVGVFGGERRDEGVEPFRLGEG